jgi:DNA polymerase-3 subunit epsilon
MILLGLDLETNSDDVKTAEIVEIGMVLWDTDTETPIVMEDILVYGHHISVESFAIHGITNQDTTLYGQSIDFAIERYKKLCRKAEYIVAHNGNEFDKPILDRSVRNSSPWIEEMADAPSNPWIDTMTDVPYPEAIKTRKLTYLAAEHGFLNPFSHRAVFDVLTMFRVLSRYDINEVIRLANEPIKTCYAQVSFDDKQKAKDRGYHWDADKKKWFKKMKESQAKTEKEQAPFPIAIL